MLEFLDNTLLLNHIMRYMAMITLFLIIIDFIWKRQNLKFSYAVIRYTILINWGIQIILMIYNWEEQLSFIDRATGPYWWAYWFMLFGSFIFPILLLHKKLGRNKWILLIVTFHASIGQTFELYVIIITSLHQDFYRGVSNWSLVDILFTRPLIMVSIIIGFDLLIQRYKNSKDESLTDDVLDDV